MDRFEAMATLLATVEAGSLSAAARQLKTPLPTVSRRISELEARLQTKLLNRSSRKLALTDAGSSYIAACKRILADVTEAERTASGEYTAPTGELVITAPTTLGRTHLIPILAEFFKTYPQIKASLTLTERAQSLVQEEIDVALRIGTLPDSSMMATRVGAVARVMCASPAYLADHGALRKPEDLADHDCIGVAGISPAQWIFNKGSAARAVPIAPRLIVSNAEAARDAACAGMGIARMFSYHAHSPVAAESLVRVLQEFDPESWPVHLVYAPDRSPAIKMRAFLDLATPRLRKALAD
jgi:DNA-binding transcriptional LysR family regulator